MFQQLRVQRPHGTDTSILSSQCCSPANYHVCVQKKDDHPRVTPADCLLLAAIPPPPTQHVREDAPRQRAHSGYEDTSHRERWRGHPSHTYYLYTVALKNGTTGERAQEVEEGCHLLALPSFWASILSGCYLPSGVEHCCSHDFPKIWSTLSPWRTTKTLLLAIVA